MVCTGTSFGLGIDCKAIDVSIHVGLSRGLLQFAQESGRVGRGAGSQKAFSVVLSSADTSKSTVERFQKELEEQECHFKHGTSTTADGDTLSKYLMDDLRQMSSFFQSTDTCCREILGPHLNGDKLYSVASCMVIKDCSLCDKCLRDLMLKNYPVKAIIESFPVESRDIADILLSALKPPSTPALGVYYVNDETARETAGISRASKTIDLTDLGSEEEENCDATDISFDKRHHSRSATFPVAMSYPLKEEGRDESSIITPFCSRSKGDNVLNNPLHIFPTTELKLLPKIDSCSEVFMTVDSRSGSHKRKREDESILVTEIMEYLLESCVGCMFCVVNGDQEQSAREIRTSNVANCESFKKRFRSSAGRNAKLTCYICSGDHVKMDCPFNLSWDRSNGICYRCTLPKSVGSIKIHEPNCFGSGCRFAKNEMKTFVAYAWTRFPCIVDYVMQSDVGEGLSAEIVDNKGSFRKWLMGISKKHGCDEVKNITAVFHEIYPMVVRLNGAQNVVTRPRFSRK